MALLETTKAQVIGQQGQVSTAKAQVIEQNKGLREAQATEFEKQERYFTELKQKEATTKAIQDYKNSLLNSGYELRGNQYIKTVKYDNGTKKTTIITIDDTGKVTKEVKRKEPNKKTIQQTEQQQIAEQLKNVNLTEQERSKLVSQYVKAEEEKTKVFTSAENKYYIQPTKENQLSVPLEVSKGLYEKIQKENALIDTQREKEGQITINGQGYSVAPSLQKEFIKSKTTKEKIIVNEVQPTSKVFPVSTPIAKQFISGATEETGKIITVVGESAINFVKGVPATVGISVKKQTGYEETGKPIYKELSTKPSTQDVVVMGTIATAVVSPTLFVAGGLYGLSTEIVNYPKISSGQEAGASAVRTLAYIGAIKPILTGGERYGKSEVIFSTAETLGKKGLTKTESKPIFEPKLENVNTIKTEYGTIEIETKPVQKPKVIKKVSTKEGIIEEKPEVTKETINQARDFNIDLSQKQQSMKGTTTSLSGGGESLQGKGTQSLTLEYQEPQIITIPDYVYPQDVISKTTSKPIYASAGITNIKIDTTTKTNITPNITPISTQEKVPISKITTEIKTVQTTEPTQKIDIIQGKTTIQRTEQQLKIEPTIKTQSRVAQKQLQQTETIKTPTEIFYIKGKPRAEMTRQLFITKAKVKGKFVTLGKFGSIGEAINRGKQFVETTASATFKVESGNEPQRIGILQGFKPSKSVRGGQVQERERRITSVGEKIEISAKGRAVQQARLQFKKNSKRLFK